VGEGNCRACPALTRGCLCIRAPAGCSTEAHGVYDRRAQAGPGVLGLPLSAAPGRYGRYMALVESIRSTAFTHGVDWTARDVDVALYRLGVPDKNT